MARTSTCFLALCALATLALADELYPDKYDFIDVDAVLRNERNRDQYYKCFLETGPCLTPDARFFKNIISEAIITKCKRCTERQKVMLEKIVVYYSEKEPEKWNKIILSAIQKSQLNRSKN